MDQCGLPIGEESIQRIKYALCGECIEVSNLVFYLQFANVELQMRLWLGYESLSPFFRALSSCCFISALAFQCIINQILDGKVRQIV